MKIIYLITLLILVLCSCRSLTTSDNITKKDYDYLMADSINAEWFIKDDPDSKNDRVFYIYNKEKEIFYHVDYIDWYWYLLLIVAIIGIVIAIMKSD